jgi:aminocarboxymuconate-semialdehyde decarboxylase
MKLDVHNHAAPAEIATFLAAEPVFGVSVRDGRWLSGGPEGDYELTEEFSDADAKIADLESHGLEGAIVSVDPPFFYYDVEAGAGAALAEVVNRGLKDMCDRYPGRLYWNATVPLQDPRRAVSVLQAQAAAGCVGVEIATSADTRPLDDEAFEPLWACAEDLRLPVTLHPAYQNAHPRFDRYHLTNTIGNMLETTIAVERLIMSGVLDRHPGLRLVTLHSGGYIPYQLGRLRHSRQVRPFPADAPADPEAYLSQLRFDTLTHDHKALAFLIDRVGADKVVMGTDLPCDMASVDPWNDLVAVAGEQVASQIAETNIETLFRLASRANAVAGR